MTKKRPSSMTKKRPSSMAKTSPQYYLRNTSSNPEGYVLWWRPDRCGYTVSLLEAGVYSSSEALDIETRSQGDTFAVAVDIALKSVSHVVPAKVLDDKMKAGREQRITYHLQKLNSYLSHTEYSTQSFQDKLTRISVPPTADDLNYLSYHIRALQDARRGASPHLKAVRFLNEEDSTSEMQAAIAYAESLGVPDE